MNFKIVNFKIHKIQIITLTKFQQTVRRKYSI